MTMTFSLKKMNEMNRDALEERLKKRNVYDEK